MSNDYLLLIADSAFIKSDILKSHKLLSIFPQTPNDGALRFTLEELHRRSIKQSEFINKILPELVLAFRPYLKHSGEQTQYLIRPTLYSITTVFLDRCLRIQHRLIQNPEKNLKVVKVDSIHNLEWLTDIQHNWHFNQDIIQRISLAINVESYELLSNKKYPEYPLDYSQRNLLFRPIKTGPADVVIKIFNKYYSWLEKKSNKKGHIQSLGLGTDKFYMAKRGFFGSWGLFRPTLNISFNESVENLELRKELLKSVLPVLQKDFENLLRDLGWKNSAQLGPLGQAFAQLFVDWFPKGFLEGFEANLSETQKHLDAENIKVITGQNLNTPQGIYSSIAAKMKGKKILGIQHGGHYGYIEDMSHFGQIEYFQYDKMFTWGWTEIESHLPQCETIPMPSPKLSEKPLKSDYLEIRPESRDVLFFSNQFHRFPHFSTCGAPRVDFIDEMTQSQVKLMSELNISGITIDHKPYHMRYLDLYPEHYRKLEKAGGVNYRLVPSQQKGLSIELIKSCRLVLWDQIGSGTLECFTAGVPCMVFWQRIYSRESKSAKSLIAELEATGIVHSDPQKLAQEIQEYLKNPQAWMTHPKRVLAIEEFCKKFAFSDPNWYKAWERKLREF